MFKYLLVICSLFVLGNSVFGQDTLEKDLKKSFRNYELIKLDKQAVRDKAKSNQPVAIQAYGRWFEFVLTPNEIRAANYKAVASTESGDRELPREEIVTFKGKLSDDYASEVRFSVTEKGLEGLIYTSDDKKFFVTKAENFSKHASDDEAIFFSEDDLIKTVDLSNDAAIPPHDNEGKPKSSFELLKSYIYDSPETAEAAAAETPDTSSALAANLKILEVATEADNQWVTQARGAAQANNEILSILNLVDGIYRRDLNLTISVTFQHAWETPDPYTPTSMDAALNSFLAYWNANYPPSRYPRDTAHLFTGKFSYQGLAYKGVICKSQTYAYGLTGRSGSVTNLITAHEIGHNLGAEHVENSGSCANSIMNPSISGSATSFCDVSKSQISTYVATYGSCLSTGATTSTPTPTPSPTPLPTPNQPLSFSISGSVYYYQGQKPVPSVLLSVSGTASSYTYTDPTGYYVLRNLTGGGYYTVAPYKTGDVNNITSVDATLVLRHVSAAAQGQSVLTPSQQTAADVNGSGNISAVDATQILRYVASGASSQTGQTGTWKFVPKERNYFPLLSSQSNQNYEAFLIGDANGSWTPPG